MKVECEFTVQSAHIEYPGGGSDPLMPMVRLEGHIHPLRKWSPSPMAVQAYLPLPKEVAMLIRKELTAALAVTVAGEADGEATG